MGVFVRLNILPHQIDEERWEEVWLTGLRILEQFPGPLAVHRVDSLHESRISWSPRILFETGTPGEHWRVEGDLESGRFAETYRLHRHLARYRAKSRRPEDDESTDILRQSKGNPEHGIVAGVRLFDDKSQGYPFHYAMLAIGILIECSFPGHAMVYGDISRSQAEKVVPWAEAAVGRPLQLPVITDGDRLFWRLVRASDGDLELALRRFRELFVERSDSAWRYLLQQTDLPEADAVRRSFLSELATYEGLRQRGAAELISALCDSDAGLDRVFDWVCGASSPGQPARVSPEELLECLCDLLVTVPPAERQVMDALTPPPDQLPSVETMLFQGFAAMSGKPVSCDFHIEEYALAAEFAARWPNQAIRFRERLRERTARSRKQLDETRQALEKRMALRDAEEHDDATPSFTPPASEHRPAAEFLDEEIARQKRKTTGIREYASRLGEQMRAGLEKNATFRRDLDASDRDELIRQISRGSRENGFALREPAWETLDQATLVELQHLTMLALMQVRESRFGEARVVLLETPELWPLLTGPEET